MKAGSIHVAIGRIHLDLPGCSSLKQKRKVVKPLVQRLRDRFGLSASEVAHQDLWKSSVIAVAAVGSDRAGLDGLVHEAVRYVRQNADAVVVDFGVEVLAAGEILPGVESSREDADVAVGAIEEKWIQEDEG